jgi:hypothetical protein
MGYYTEILELGVERKPQHTLNAGMTNFIKEHDGPNNLLIVYYTGHGNYNKEREVLILSATREEQGGFRKAARAEFNEAETYLKSASVEADVLTILDTCFGSNIQKGGAEDERTYELLSACALDQTTVSGPRSFTQALIKSLRELLEHYGDKSFTTFHLLQKINLQEFRRDTPAMLWDRLQHGNRHITLNRLDKQQQQENAVLLRHHPIGGYLNLRFALGKELLEESEIKALSQDLASIFNRNGKLSVRRIDWMGIRKPARETITSTVRARHAFKHWRKTILAGKKRRRHASPQRPSAEQMDVIPEESTGLCLPTNGAATPLTPDSAVSA